MADTPEQGGDKESELRDAIDTFEQILEAIPNDRLALETLSDAHEQLGDLVRALEYYVRLGEVIIDDGDRAVAPRIREKLESLGAQDASAQEMAKRLAALTDEQDEELQPKRRTGAYRRSADITAELALAWNLVQAGEFTQEDYSSVVQDLTESSSRNNEVPVTVLHVLRDRAFKNIERIMNFLSQNSGLPIIPLASFELQKDANSLLPEEVMRHRGAIVYELMGKDALIAILNPYDTELFAEIEKLTGRNCHYYLATAEDYDRYLDNMRKAAAVETVKKPEEK